MDVTSNYSPSQGLTIISQSGSQQYPDKLDSYSAISTQILCSDFNKNNKFCMDSCWESENIYYANYDTGLVKKIMFDGTEIASLQLVSPFMVSVIQNSSSMNDSVTYPPQEDNGCWVVDDDGTIIRTDNNLNALSQFVGISDATGIIADVDGGCYVSGVYLGASSLVKLSSTATLLAVKTYASFSPSASNFRDMSLDVSGNLWFTANDKIYSMRYQNGQIVSLLSSPLDPINDIPLVPGVEELHVGGTDVDRNSLLQYLYVTVGNSYKSYVIKYDQDGTLVTYKQYTDISYPYIIKAIQGLGSDSVFILEDSSKWDAFDYGSSSSSSSSSYDIHCFAATPRDSIRDWYSVASSSDGTKLVACVNGGYLYTSDDSGVTWNPQDSIRSWWHVASSADGVNLVACEGGGKIYNSIDSGATWTPRDSDRYWISVAGSSDGVKWVACDYYGVGSGGQIYTSIDSGDTWAPRDSDRSWRAIASSSDGVKLVACVSGGLIYTSTDSGVTWIPRDSVRNWYSVASSADGVNLVAAEIGGLIYTSTDSGVTWIPRDSVRNWYSLSSSSDGSRLFAGALGDYMYSSENYGVTWTPRGNFGYWYSVASASGGTKLVSCDFGGLLYTIENDCY